MPWQFENLPLLSNYFGLVFALAYGFFYVNLDKKTGALAAVLCFLCWVGASSLSSQLGPLAWKFVNLPLLSNYFGLVFALAYGFFYVNLDKKAGALAAVLCFLCWVGASSLSNQLGPSLAWKVALAAQVVCWTGQFIGHGVYEKRAPALLDNLSQAFLMAPFFVLLEALEKFFEYEPYPGFHAKVRTKVAAEIRAWKEMKPKKIS
ncbi:hypothetical protein Dimus_004920 [Dionaea muscipula]